MTDLLTRTSVASPAPLADPPGALAGTVAEGLALTVAPSTGRFRPTDGLGQTVTAGQVIGHVTGGRGRADAVVAPVDGIVRSLLARAGQQVTRGQALAWLEQGVLCAAGVPAPSEGNRPA